MLSATTLSFPVLALVPGDRPWRTGVWCYPGGSWRHARGRVLAAFVLGDKAASTTSYPKPWVAVFDLAAAGSCAGRATRSVPSTWPAR